MNHDTSDLYERVTKQIVEAIERGAEKFRMPWHVTEADYFQPVNAVSKRPYRGINLVALWALAEERGYESGLWATYNQWKELGAQVKKGEKAALIVFWKSRAGKKEELERDEEGDEAKRTGGVLAKGYHVFNVAQVEGFTPKEPPRLSEEERIERAEAFFRGLGPDIRHGGAVACYERGKDLIRMPSFSRFHNAQAYYSILAHEVTHWSGAPGRLDRQTKHRFGSESYAMEELVAELGAAFLCATLRISVTPRPEHAAYLASWLEVLKRDKRALFHAASQAQKAVDWMEAQQPHAKELAA